MAISRKPAYSYDDLNSIYQQDLNRPASQDEYAGWVNGDYTGTPDDLGAIGLQIYNSDEAQGVRRRKAAPPTDSTNGTNPPAPPVNQSGASSGSPESAVQNYYTTYLGRAANADDPQKWLTGAYGYGTDLPTIENAIRNSGEAQAYAKAHPGSGGGTSGGGTGDPGDYLLSLLQGGMDRDQAIAQTSKQYNLPPGVDGYPLWYAGNNTIGLKGSYLANVNGVWNKVMRGPEGAGGGGGPKAGGFTLPSLSLPQLGASATPPGSSGIYRPDYLQQLGQDPFSQSIAGGITAAMDAAAGRLHSTPQQRAIAMEGARAPYESARKVQLENAKAALADRGTLGEPGQQSGLLSDAVGRIETSLAPAYTGAVSNAMSLLDQNEQQAITQLLQGASTGTQRQQVLSDIALRELDQNRLWNQFLAQLGLDRDKAMYDVQLGQGNQLLTLFQLYIQQAQVAAGGYI